MGLLTRQIKIKIEKSVLIQYQYQTGIKNFKNASTSTGTGIKIS
jgi:hypothetical protein